MIAAVLVVSVLGVFPADGAVAAEDERELWFTQADRTWSEGLDGARVTADAEVVVTPEHDVEQVNFYLDDHADPARQGAVGLRDTTAPFAFPLRVADLTPGAHDLVALVRTASGATRAVTASFVVEPDVVVEAAGQGPAPTRGDPNAGVPLTSVVSVHTHGAIGDGVTDDTDAIRRALDDAGARGAEVVFPPGTYRVTGELTVPEQVDTVRLDPDTVVRQEADAAIFAKRGTTTPAQYTVTGGATRNSTALTLDGVDGVVEGDWLYLGSDDQLNSSKQYKAGALRRVVAVDPAAARVTLDRPLHRDLTRSPRAWEVVLASPMRISGGVLEHADPLTAFNPLLAFDLVDTPVVNGVEIRECGGSGVRLVGTVGGSVDVYVHDCVDDYAGKRFGSGNHYGYGVEVAGAARDLVVTGRAHHVRHAFTTNGAYSPPDKRLRLIGEPEDVTVTMDVWETTSSGLDTHEPGYGIRFVDCTVTAAGTYKRDGSTEGKEGGHGIFIRARGTEVVNTVVTGSAEEGIHVSWPGRGADPWTPDEGPRIVDTHVRDTEGRRGVYLKQPGHLHGVTVDGAHQFGVHFEDVPGSTARDVSIELRDYSRSAGVVGARDGVTLENVTVTGAANESL